MRFVFLILLLFYLTPMDLKAQKSTRFEITNIELIIQDNEKFLKLTIEDKKKDLGLYPYPLFKIVSSNGKVIAERGLSAYGLVEIELIPTKLKKLPANFECTVFLTTHGSEPNPHEIKYKAK